MLAARQRRPTLLPFLSKVLPSTQSSYSFYVIIVLIYDNWFGFFRLVAQIKLLSYLFHNGPAQFIFLNSRKYLTNKLKYEVSSSYQIMRTKQFAKNPYKIMQTKQSAKRAKQPIASHVN